MFRPSRSAPSGGTDPFLPWKVRTFFVGAVLAMAGLATGVSWLAAAAIAVLGAGLALRFASRWRAGRRPVLDAQALDGQGTRESAGPWPERAGSSSSSPSPACSTRESAGPRPERAAQAASGMEETKRP